MKYLKTILFKKNIYLAVLIMFFSIYPADAQINKNIVRENNMGIAYMGQFDFIKARNIFDKLVKENPLNLELKINLAIATLNRQEKGDELIALAQLKEALKKDKHNVHALYCSGLLELYLGNPEKALNFFYTVEKKEPFDPEVLYFIGKTLLQLSRYEKSIDFFNKAKSIDQYMSSAYYGLVQAYRQLGKRDIAMQKIKDFQKIKNNPRVRSLEFKYTKMGKRGEVIAIDLNEEEALKNPAGPVFQKADFFFEDKNINWLSRNESKIKKNSSITICDINGDGRLDVFISGAVNFGSEKGNAIFLKNKHNEKYTIDKNHPLSRISNVNTALWGDLNNDTITDVYFCRNGKNQLWQQGNNNRWNNISIESKIENGDLNTIDGLLFDADHDGDLDIFLINENGANELLNNDRNGSYRPIAAEYGLTGTSFNSKSLIAADLDNDRDTDIIIINKKSPHEVFINDRLWKYHKGKGFTEFINSDIVTAVCADINANGNIEIYTQSSEGTISVWEKNNEELWKKKTLIKANKDSISSDFQIVLADINGNGNQELLYQEEDQLRAVSLNGKKMKTLWSSKISDKRLTAWTSINSLKGPSIIGLNSKNKPVLWTPGSGRHDFALIKLAGTKKDNLSWRSNSSGIGTKLSARIGSKWSVFNTFKNSSGAGQSFQPVMVGMHGKKSIDFIALDWSDGVFQTELNLKTGKIHKIVEKQRQLSSCPVLFAWNGEKIEFVSDLLGVGGMGYAVAPGEYAPPRPWENFIFAKDAIKPLNNKYIIKLTEPMEEAVYLDSVKLIAYDLPKGWFMTLDERMGISGPMPTGKPIFYKNKISPVKAFNNRNEIVTDTILSRNLIAAPPGDLDHRFIGMLKKDHKLTIEFSHALDQYSGDAYLVIDGWVEYPYSQTSFASWQAGASYRAPTIEIERPDGNWEILLDQFGYPAGMPRQMSVPLGNNLEGVKKIRISTNQEIYWDKIFIAFSQKCSEVERIELKLDRAILEEIGFPERTEKPQHLPYYDFSNRKPLWDTRTLEGNYTRLGKVKELINKKDNALAIFRAGEGISMEFIEPEFPVKTGWSRVIVLETNGWCKDMDLYTKDNETLAPIPSSGKIDKVAKKLQKKYNIRYLNGKQ